MTDKKEESVSDAKKAGSSRKGFVAFFREIVIVILAALVLTSVTRAFVMQPFAIPSGSMLNTLQGAVPGQPDDRIMVIKFGDFHRGDIVVFEDFAHWYSKEPVTVPAWKRGLELIGMLPDTSKSYLVKRVIGMPGDRITCCSPTGRISVNGQELDESEYLFRDSLGTLIQASDFSFEVVVPQGRVFVMGDHRNASADSRCHLRDKGIDAFVPIDKIVGPTKAITLPVNRIRGFSPPEIFSHVPEPTEAAPQVPVINADQVLC
ncbi:MAG: signal peptidase I [Propionibacteriaceae bacterium]